MRSRRVAGRAGHVFHVVNRAIEGQLLFRDFGEYLAFKHLLAKALRKVPIRLLGYCLMPNHWHFVLWPRTDLELTQFVQRLASTHARALRKWRGTERKGAVYQSRYSASRIDTERYFYVVMRYVERNAVRARLVDRAEDWPWSSASGAASIDDGVPLSPWPLARPRRWLAYVNQEEALSDLEFIRCRTKRNEPIAQPQVDAESAVGPAADTAETSTDPVGHP